MSGPGRLSGPGGVSGWGVLSWGVPGQLLPLPPVDRQTPVDLLPCPKLRLRAVIICKLLLTNIFTGNKDKCVVSLICLGDTEYCFVLFMWPN